MNLRSLDQNQGSVLKFPIAQVNILLGQDRGARVQSGRYILQLHLCVSGTPFLHFWNVQLKDPADLL